MSKVKFAPLAAFADVTMGQSPGSDLYNTEGKGLPFLQGCAEFGARNPQPTIYCNPPLRVAEAGSVLISVRAPVGTMNYAEQAYCIGRGLAAFRAKRDISNSVFLKHAVEQNGSYLHRRSQGSTFAAVSADDIKTVPVPAFDLPTQNKVARVFETIDGAIESTETLIEKYQQIKAGLMHDLFTRGIGADGKLRPPREQAPELYQQTPIGWIPKEWRVLALQEACSAVVDCPHSTPTFIDGGVFVARTMYIKDGVFLEELASTVSESEYVERVSRSIPQPGDVILTREAPVGEAFVIPAGMKICLGQRVMLIKPKASLLDSNYLVEQIYSGRLKSRISDLTAGTTNPHLNVADVRELLIPLPTFSEQEQMVVMIGAMNARILSETASLRKMRAQKAGLMHDLLTGKRPLKMAARDAKAEAHV